MDNTKFLYSSDCNYEEKTDEELIDKINSVCEELHMTL